MYKIIGSFLLLALFVSASSFTTTNKSSVTSAASLEKVASKKFVINLVVVQTGPGTIRATWANALGTGPYTVTIQDMTATGGPIVIVTFANFVNQGGLLAGHTYRVTVADAQNFQFQFITLT